jgi:sulfotransferase family protein
MRANGSRVPWDLFVVMLVSGGGAVDAVMTPILVHIGYHKTATKWLRAMLFRDASAGYQWLGKGDDHPVNRLITVRPLEFDAAAIRRELQPSIDDAVAAELVPVVCFGRLSGHPFSGGYDSKEIADRLKQVLPEGRVLIVVREQRSMIVSTYKQYVKAGGSAKLDQFLNRPYQDWRVPTFDFAHFEYHRLIGYYRALYGPEAVLALPYERLIEDGRGFIEEIARFAGHPVPEEILDRMSFARMHGARPALALAATRPLNRFGPRNTVNPAPLFESKAIFNLSQRLQKLDHRRSWAQNTLATRSEAQLVRTVQEMVGDRYAAGNRILGEMIGVDLAAYGWTL